MRLFTCLLAITAAAAVLLSGGFVRGDYPPPQRERIEWCDIWFTDADKTDLPRVLLIGDSITRGYFGPVEERLAGKAYCGRYTTSRSVCDPVMFQELELVLGQYDYAVIHVNNGLHGWGYTEAQYSEGLERLLNILAEQAPGAKLVWATTTPVTAESGMAEHRQRVAARNALARELVNARGIAVDDLHALAIEHTQHFADDGVHFSASGRTAQGGQVAEHISALLEGTPAD